MRVYKPQSRGEEDLFFGRGIAGLRLRFLAGLVYTLDMTVEQRIEKTTSGALAEGVGVHASHVRHVLRGTRVPSLEVAAKLAKKLGVSLDAFYRYYSKQAQESVN